MPMNSVPQAEPPPAPQCYSPCTSACQSVCQSPCQSPQHSVAGGSAGGGGAGGELDPDTVSQQQHHQFQQAQQTPVEISYDQQSMLSYNPHQQSQHHSQYQQHIIPLEEFHRRQSVERLDSPQVCLARRRLFVVDKLRVLFVAVLLRFDSQVTNHNICFYYHSVCLSAGLRCLRIRK